MLRDTPVVESRLLYPSKLMRSRHQKIEVQHPGKPGQSFCRSYQSPHCIQLRSPRGGVKGSLTLGESDELGFNVIKNKVHVHDLNATILHLLGFNHLKLTHRFQGRDYRLTNVHGEVVRELLA